MNARNQYADTSSWSYYMDADYYSELARLRELFDDDWPESEPAVLHEATAFLSREARLIDEGRFNHWLELFSDECLYWVPITPGGGDPQTEVSHAFDDRRRLTDRVYWLRTGLAYSQIPASRTRHLISNVEVLDVAPGSRLVRSNFAVYEFRAGATKVYAGWYAHALVQTEQGWRIKVKRANLLDSEQYHENLTLVF
ncbi:aromatic-ring-hydroxylating dioxygenase subunit beta [Nocardioides sp. NPDC101246]|uniref:aromatic-ring-hydroxylating dioxygenase subunit beta n=1 Tax=Nocardioides sp. NPDC101246 TaxID=3364336 RepID=UPI003823AD55